MKKIIILTLCATSFLLAQSDIDIDKVFHNTSSLTPQQKQRVTKVFAEALSLAPQKKQCVSFADTAGEGCLVYRFHNDIRIILDINEVKDEQGKEIVECETEWDDTWHHNAPIYCKKR